MHCMHCDFLSRTVFFYNYSVIFLNCLVTSTGVRAIHERLNYSMVFIYIEDNLIHSVDKCWPYVQRPCLSVGSLRIDDFRTTAPLGHLIVRRRRSLEI